MPPEGGVLTLGELHDIIKDVWLIRHDVELEAEQAARRKGRPKSPKEMKLEEIKLREAEEYRTGMGKMHGNFIFYKPLTKLCAEVVDLTHAPTVKLFRGWDQREFAYIQMLRFIRISSSNPLEFTVSKPGKHYSLRKDDNADLSRDQEMDTIGDTSVQDFLAEPPARFSSTIMAMDEPL
jgi:translation machinery-associated protein 16